MEWVRLQEDKAKGHALSGRVKLSSNPVLPFHSSVHTRPSGMSSMALPARWADMSRSRVSLQRRVRLINHPWTTLEFSPCAKKDRGFPRTVRGKEQATLIWGSTRDSLLHDSRPALATPHAVMDIQCRWCESKSWTTLLGQREEKKLNCYWETVPCIFLISLHWNMAADR